MGQERVAAGQTRVENSVAGEAGKLARHAESRVGVVGM